MQHKDIEFILREAMEKSLERLTESNVRLVRLGNLDSTANDPIVMKAATEMRNQARSAYARALNEFTEFVVNGQVPMYFALSRRREAAGS